jgi:TetR/AcrR family transcriptional regulator, mexCD-oprJ operon repressor
VAAVIEGADPGRGDPAEALERVLSATWRALGRFHALVALNTSLPQDELHALHRPVLDQLKPLIRRGQRDGSFRRDVPAEWHLSMLLALVHAASAEQSAGRMGETKLERAIVATVVGAISA